MTRQYRGLGRGVAAFLFCLFLLVPGLTDAADADELIKQGVALRRSGDDAGALQKFEQAYQSGGGKKALAQLGFAEQALGRWTAAYEHLTQALTDNNDAWIKKNRPLINESLERVNDHVGQLAILGGSPGAEVRIDGSSRGKLPLARPLLLTTGAVTIDLSAPGFISRQRITTVRARETVRESFDALEPALNRGTPAAAGDAGVAGGVTRVAALPPPAPSQPADTTPPAGGLATGDQGSSQGSLRPAAKWVAWGAGALSLGVGIFGAVRQNSAGTDFSIGCAIDSRGDVVPTGSAKTQAECQSLKNKVDSNFTLEVVGLIGAGVFVAAGVVLWLTEPQKGNGDAGSSTSQTSSLSCSPGLTAGFGPSIGCRVAF